MNAQDTMLEVLFFSSYIPGRSLENSFPAAEHNQGAPPPPPTLKIFLSSSGQPVRFFRSEVGEHYIPTWPVAATQAVSVA